VLINISIVFDAHTRRDGLFCLREFTIMLPDVCIGRWNSRLCDARKNFAAAGILFRRISTAMKNAGKKRGIRNTNRSNHQGFINAYVNTLITTRVKFSHSI